MCQPSPLVAQWQRSWSVLRRDAQWNALLAVYDQLDETVETGHAPPWVGRMIALAHWIRDAVGPVS